MHLASSGAFSTLLRLPTRPGRETQSSTRKQVSLYAGGLFALSFHLARMVFLNFHRKKKKSTYPGFLEKGPKIATVWFCVVAAPADGARVPQSPHSLASRTRTKSLPYTPIWALEALSTRSRLGTMALWGTECCKASGFSLRRQRGP